MTSMHIDGMTHAAPRLMGSAPATTSSAKHFEPPRPGGHGGGLPLLGSESCLSPRLADEEESCMGGATSAERRRSFEARLQASELLPQSASLSSDRITSMNMLSTMFEHESRRSQSTLYARANDQRVIEALRTEISQLRQSATSLERGQLDQAARVARSAQSEAQLKQLLDSHVACQHDTMATCEALARDYAALASVLPAATVGAIAKRTAALRATAATTTTLRETPGKGSEKGSERTPQQSAWAAEMEELLRREGGPACAVSRVRQRINDLAASIASTDHAVDATPSTFVALSSDCNPLNGDRTEQSRTPRAPLARPCSTNPSACRASS